MHTCVCRLLSTMYFLLAVCILCASLYFLRTKRTRKLPPGPWGLPILGYAPFLGSKPHETYASLGEKYGSIITVNHFSENWIILNTREAIDEAFVKQGKVTAGRLANAVVDPVCNGCVSAFTSGHLWKTQREFEMRALKYIGKKATEDRILEEFAHLHKFIADKNGEPCECQTTVSKAVANITLNLLTSMRLAYDDSRFDGLSAVAGYVVSGNLEAERFGTLFVMPFLRFFPPFKQTFKEFVSSNISLLDEMNKIIQERKATFNVNCIRDFMDLFFLEMSKKEVDKTFTERQLRHSLQNLLVASSNTTTNTIRWSILALVLYPEYQKRMAKEISDAIESRGEISLKYQDELSFTRAFILEIHRYCNLAPLAVPHMAMSDFTLKGYKIPKGTPIVANLWAVHRSAKLFDDPNKFRPERFIDDHGKYIANENVIPFCVGTRRCTGEQLGRMTPTLLVAKIVQHFEIQKADDCPLHSLDDGVLAVSFSAKAFSVIFRPK